MTASQIGIYNTYSDKLEPLDLKRPVGIYVCGITPYDTTHLGHAFTFCSYDILIRYLRFLGAEVTYVQNVTDIDDDILIKARKLKVDWKKFGDRETKKYLGDMDALNVLRPDYYPKATENVAEMIKIVQKLIEIKIAYVKNGNVYFSIKKDKNFGKLSRFGYPAMLEIANDRGNFPLDSNKKDPLDFVLWQKRKENEPYWDSPWSQGRSGWHIECSAMIMRYLGQTITIHGGGQDLIFPHHECEIAQSENYFGKQFVKTWMHTGMVYCEKHKMSKSLGNMVFVHELLQKYTSNQIRILLAMHHYREPFNYEESEFIKAKEIVKLVESKVVVANDLTASQVQETAADFFDSLNNDLDTPFAIASLEKLTKSENKNIGEVIYKCSQLLGIRF